MNPSSIRNSLKALSTSWFVNLSPKVMRECLNISASILPLISKASKALRMVSSSSAPPTIFFSEKHDHLCEVDWTRGLRKHALGLTIGNGFADGAESSNDVAGGQETVLIGVHDTEGFFELLDLPLREESKHIGATLLGFL